MLSPAGSQGQACEITGSNKAGSNVRQRRVADQVVGACRIFAMLMNLPCDGIEKSLSVVRVPMPEPGEQFQVPADLLSDAEKAFFDRLVTGE